MDKLCNYLKSLREAKELSLRQVEIKVGLPYTTLSMVESGKRKATPKVLNKLAKAYNVDKLDLYRLAGYLDYADYVEDNEKTHIPVLR